MSDALTEFLSTHAIIFVPRADLTPVEPEPPIIDPPIVEPPKEYVRPALPAGVAIKRVLCEFGFSKGTIPPNGGASPIGLEDWRYGRFRFVLQHGRFAIQTWINTVQARKVGIGQIGTRILEWISSRGVARTVHPFRMTLVHGLKSAKWLVCWETKSGNDQTYGLELEPVGDAEGNYTFWLNHFRTKDVIKPRQRVVFKPGQAVDVVIRYTRHRTNGRIEIWIDGQLTFDESGRPTDFATGDNWLNTPIGYGVCCYSEDAVSINGEEVAIEFEEYEICESA